MTQYILELTGLIFFLFGLSMLVNKDFYVSYAKDVQKDRGHVLLGALINLVIGLSIVLSHIGWNSTEEIVVCIIGWAATVKGVTLVLVPGSYKKMAKKLASGSAVMAGGFISLVLGALISYLAFFA